MTSTLTWSSFLSPTKPHRHQLKTQKFILLFKNPKSFPQIFSKKGNGSASSDETQPEGSANSNPFRLNFGKIPDVQSLIQVVNQPASGLSFGNPRRKDPGTVFVAGATGQAGVRIAETLLRQGFSVRAGVADLGDAQELARIAAQYKVISKEEARRLNAVESSFEDAESIAKAIGNASKVVVTIGPAENGPTTEVTTLDALQIIQGAQLAGVGHVAIIYDGNNIATSTNNVLDGISSFFNNIFSRSQPLTIKEFLEKVVETDVSYTLIKTSLTEDFSPESSYNLVMSVEGSTGANDYKVAMSQIASLVADVFSNTAVAENKVVEVFTDPSAPVRSIEELFSAIPEDGRRQAYAEAFGKAKAEEEALIAAEKAREAAEAAKKLEEEVKKLSEQEARAASLAEEAQEKAEAAGASMESLLNKTKDFSSGLSWDNLSSQISSAVKKSAEIPKVQIATVRGQAKARSLTPQKAVVKRSTSKPVVSSAKEEPKTKAKVAETKAEVRKVFGGLFSQETIYVDDD